MHTIQMKSLPFYYSLALCLFHTILIFVCVSFVCKCHFWNCHVCFSFFCDFLFILTLSLCTHVTSHALKPVKSTHFSQSRALFFAPGQPPLICHFFTSAEFVHISVHTLTHFLTGLECSYGSDSHIKSRLR